MARLAGAASAWKTSLTHRSIGKSRLAYTHAARWSRARRSGFDASVSQSDSARYRCGRAPALSAPPVGILASLGTRREHRSALPLVLDSSDQSLSPVLADIIGARRMRTAVMISSG